jgi:peptidoglycan hydrolase-like protein with peptidoglycan-binding domain
MKTFALGTAMCVALLGACSSNSDTGSPLSITVDVPDSAATSTAQVASSSRVATDCIPTAAPDPAADSRLRWQRLSEGDKSDRIIVVQYLLRAANVVVTADGKFGPATKGAVSRFQLSTGVSQTGSVGPTEWLNLVGGCSASTSPEFVKALQAALGLAGYAQRITGELDELTTGHLAQSRTDSGSTISGVVTPADWLTLVGVGD